ncbi:MAG: hypothetical protein UV73_C0005G0056 [Candidatus Gottesmanbacteria bacterium GW2011_GWA2_43_14]|uniref:Glycosyltransferase RgtA/B/C/D-like domain-containing protein n=1 Tax=Candidatus Gottesmanbacteria bacterium GW2011_GWA2_43_14 TaxID=1618443 RepID=A0A0G1DJG0_9BACT|nr:MAG: hypothetical protein UV73_C0005G0056 [Candidatus Gottesmanbacteria bacterium GW2011_GWA2_43_14]
MKKTDIAFFCLSTAVILFLNLYPLVKLARRAPSGRTYALIHNNVQDFYLYQSLMNEGATGSWLIYDPYTTEAHRSSIIFSFFTVLGKISRIFNLPYALTYHAARITGSLLFFLAAATAIRKLKIPHSNIAYFFFLFASPFLTSKNISGAITEIPFMYWWTGMDAVRRAAYLPHHMFGGFLLIVSVILVNAFIKSTKKVHLVFLSLTAILMAYLHTPSLFILLIILPPAVLIYLAVKKNLSISGLFGLAAFWIIGFVSLALMVSQSNRGFPWSQYLEWEKTLQYPVMEELAGSFGLLLPLAILGTLAAFASGRFSRILVACWFAVPLLLLPFAPMLNISNIRLIQGIPFLTLGMLAVLGTEVIIRLVLKLISVFINQPLSKKQKLIFPVNRFVYAILIVLFSLSVYPTIAWSVKDQIREYTPIFGNTYLDNRLQYVFSFIKDRYPAKIIVLATFYTGNYLPVYTHTLSFIGHTSYTANISMKEKAVMRFFENKMTQGEAEKFLRDNKIRLVFQGPEEKPLFKGLLYPEILKPVYREDVANVYEVK